MLSIWIFLKDVSLMLRDKRALLTLIVMPLVLIAILGTASSNLFRVENESLDQAIISYPLAVVDLDRTESSRKIVDEFLLLYLQDYIEPTVMSREEADQALDNHAIEQLLLIPRGFEQAAKSSKQATVQLITKGDSSILLSILRSRFQQYNLAQAGTEGVTEVLLEYYEELLNDQKLRFGAEGGTRHITLWQDPREVPQQAASIIKENVKGEGRTVDSFQYYAVAMGVMFLLMTVVSLVRTMIREKNDMVFDRQLITLLQTWQYLHGKFFGMVVISMLQLTVIVGGTALLFGVDWGDSLAGLLLTMISFTISTSGLVVFVGSLIKTEAIFSHVGMIGTQLLAALGGSFVPFFLFPDWMIMLTKVIPNALALQMFIELMTGGTSADIWQEALTVTVVGLVLMTIAWIRLSHKRGADHI
ncbi:ABC transporter permease [Paenibacillus septentrionalis]|uniref:ABC transporter permease n=1 Tax=Paenibacillus septentrionalis TaxID=429342 RepID=A0ABW1V4S4_9BACL